MFSLSIANHLKQILSPLVRPNFKIKSSTLLRAYATFWQLQSDAKDSPSDLLELYSALISRQFDGLDIAFFGRFQWEDPAQFSDAYKAFLTYDPLYFLRFVVPDLVAQPDRLWAFCQRRFGGNIPLICQHIINVKSTKYEPSDNADASEADVLKRLYGIYCSIESRENIRLDRADFEKLYAYVNLYPLDRSEIDIQPVGYNSKSLYTAIDVLNYQLSLSRQQQIQLLSSFFSDPLNAPNTITEYISKVPSFAPKGSGVARTISLDKALNYLAKVPPLDILCSVSICKRIGSPDKKRRVESQVIPNDISLENGLIYTLFTAELSAFFPENVNIAVIFPSPFFIRKWIRDNSLRGQKVDFILQDDALANLISYHYHEGSYDLDPGENVRFISANQWNARGPENNSDAHSQHNYRIILFFGCGMTHTEQDSWFQYIKNTSQESCQIYALVASYEFENAASPFSSELCDPYFRIQSIALIPQGINNSTHPRRKLFLKCVLSNSPAILSSSEQRTTALYSYALNTDLKTQALSLRNDYVKVEQRDLTDLYRSVRKLYQAELLARRATGRKNTPSFSYQFTPEITIWCTKSYPKNDPLHRPRIEAFLCYPSDSGKAEEGFADRGKPIKETRKRITRLEDCEVLSWLESDYPFEALRPRHSTEEMNQLRDSGASSYTLKPIVKIRDEIIRIFTPRLAGQDIALKTLWYLYPDLEDEYTSQDYSALRDIVTNTDLGQIPLSKITPASCEELLLLGFPSLSREQLLRFIEIISVALDKATEYGYCKQNPLDKVIQDRSLQGKLFQQVRDALTKKHFTKDELFRVFDAIDTKLKAGEYEYIGVLIRLLTGLDCNTICGLYWDDFVQLKDYQIYKIVVSRQAVNNGKDIVGFRSLTDYRCIPCVSLLEEALSTYRQKIAVLCAGAKLPKFIVGTTQSLIGGKYQAYSPRKLAQISKEIIAAAGIDDRIIEVPDLENGTKETNLNRYNGDFFRENFRHWALQHGKLTMDEVQYLLGNKPETTFGIFYCDYLNDASQLMMYVKLQRLDALLRREHPPTLRSQCDGTRSFSKDFPGVGSSPRQLYIWLSMSSQDARAHIRLDCDYGLSTYTATLSETDGSEEDLQ